MIKTNKLKLSFIFIAFFFNLFISNNSEGSEYIVGTYNILAGKKNSSWEKRKENMCNFILFNNYDILGTQEVSAYQLEYLNNKLNSIYSFCGVDGSDGKNKGELCVIFYKTNKFELLESDTFWLSETPKKISKGWDASLNRICTWVRLRDKNNKNEIWFFNTHLDHKGIKAREESCKLILRKIRELCPKEANIVLVGDFNINHNNSILINITENQLLKDTGSSAKYKWIPTGTFNGDEIDKISMWNVDYIFVSKTSNVLRYGILNNNSFIIDDKPVTDFRKLTSNDVKNKTISTLPLSDHYSISVCVDFKDSYDSKDSKNDSIENYLLKKIFKKK